MEFIVITLILIVLGVMITATDRGGFDKRY